MPCSGKMPATATDQVTPEEANDAIRSYTRVVERRLKPALRAASTHRDKTFQEIAELQQMSKALDILDLTADGKTDAEHGSKRDETGSLSPALQTRVNIGEEFYVRANIYKLDRVIVDVGLGMLVEMSREEARDYVDDRTELLETEAKKHSKRISEVQAHLESVMQCLSELRRTSESPDFLAAMSAAEDA